MTKEDRRQRLRRPDGTRYRVTVNRRVHYVEPGENQSACLRFVDDPAVAGHSTADPTDVTCRGCRMALDGEAPRRERKVHLSSPDGRTACGMTLKGPRAPALMTGNLNDVTCRGCLALTLGY